MDEPRSVLTGAVLGMPWILPEHYDALRARWPDGARFPLSYDAWRADAESADARARQRGIQVLRITLIPDEVARWCAQHGREVDQAARDAYIGAVMEAWLSDAGEMPTPTTSVEVRAASPVPFDVRLFTVVVRPIPSSDEMSLDLVVCTGFADDSRAEYVVWLEAEGNAAPGSPGATPGWALALPLPRLLRLPRRPVDETAELSIIVRDAFRRDASVDATAEVRPCSSFGSASELIERIRVALAESPPMMR